MGPLANHNPMEDPVAAQRAARQRYQRGLAAHGMAEDSDGNVIDRNAQEAAEAAPVDPVELFDEPPVEKAASYMPTNDLENQETERPHDVLPDAKLPAVARHPKKGGNKLLARLKSRTVVDAEKTKTPADVGQPGDERSPPASRSVPEYNPTWSAASTGAQDKVAEEDDIRTFDHVESIAEMGWQAAHEHHEKVAKRKKVELSPVGERILRDVGLPASEIGDWLIELAEEAADRVKKVSGGRSSDSLEALISDNPNPFFLTTHLERLFGEEWLTWEPETLKEEIERRTKMPVLAWDRILSVKLCRRMPSIFFKKVNAAEKICVALSDTQISPGDLEELPPEWISVAVAVLNSMREKGESEPEFSGKVSAFLAANLIEDGMVLAPTILRPLDKHLSTHTGDETLRGQALDGYIEALVSGPTEVEETVALQVNRLLACHVAPMRVLTEL